MLIVVNDEVVDLALQISHGVEGAAADSLLRDQPEPAFDLIEPGRIGGGVMQMEARSTRQPSFDSGVFVRAVIVGDQMHIELLGDTGLNVPQENSGIFDVGVAPCTG